MNCRMIAMLVSLLALPFLAGCAGSGYSHTLFATKSNFGLDVDTKPPTAEISLARREIAVSPTFEDGQTLPVMGSFRVHSGLSLPFFADVSTTFSGGDAALYMSALFTDDLLLSSNAVENNKTRDAVLLESSRLYLSTNVPAQVEWFWPFWRYHIHNRSQVRPLVFGTDTTIGAKAAWSGLAAQIPDSVKVGFSRKELAWAPIYGRDEEPFDMILTNKTAGPIVVTTNAIAYSVKMPSFLATMETATKAGSLEKSGIKHLQFFATGRAAEQLALRSDVRSAMRKRFEPDEPAPQPAETKRGSATSHAVQLLQAVSSAQSNSVNRIAQLYAAETNATKQSYIVTTAQSLGLVGAATATTNLVDHLRQAINPDRPANTEKFFALERQIKELP